MSTDYYWRWAHCDCCGRYTDTHMFGTGLLFRAYSREPGAPRKPFLFPIASVGAWRQVTGLHPGVLIDEYGNEHDITEFWADLKPGPTDWGTQAGMNAFQDDEGFWLTYTDFGGPHP